MRERKDFGEEGERLAAGYLEGRGMSILERNWRFGHKEIDLIAREGNLLVVVEVKARHEPVLEMPEQAINRQKRQYLISAAHAYVKYCRSPLEVRFDVVYVVFGSGDPHISHIRDAFFPTLW